MSRANHPRLVGAFVGATIGALTGSVLAVATVESLEMGFVIDMVVGGVVGALLGRMLDHADGIRVIVVGLAAGFLALPVSEVLQAAGWLRDVVSTGPVSALDAVGMFAGAALNPVLSAILYDPSPLFLLASLGILWSSVTYRLVHGTRPGAWLSAA
jgi:uncharacterized membrane protein YeaQ/YmgE (transglycosylase-associated protein family)